MSEFPVILVLQGRGNGAKLSSMKTETLPSLDLPALWADLQTKNAAVANETRKALRSHSGPPSRGPGSAYDIARQAYRAFWDMPGADEFASKQLR